MATIINAISTGVGGLVQTGDASGILELQTGGSQAVTINASQNVGLGTNSPGANHRLEISGGKYLAITSNVGSPAPTSPSQNSGLFLGWNRSNGNGESNIVWGTGLGGAPSLQFATWDGTIYTERMSISSAGVLAFNSGYGSAATAYGCRAWVNFNGTGTVAIRASGNVSSITDNGVGDYTINFSTAMPDVNYAMVGGGGSTVPSPFPMGINNTTAPTTSACRLIQWYMTGTTNQGPQDGTWNNVSFFR